MRKDRERVRITAQLVSAEDGFHIWSDSYDRDMADIFAVQEEIAGEIVLALGFAMPENATPTGPVPEETIAAHDFYLLGLHRWNNRSSTEDLEATLAYFERAAREDSLFAKAHAAMALIYAVLPQYDLTYSVDDAIRLGKAEAARAAELDPTLAEPDAALCQIATWYEWKWTEALERCQRALELAPNCATGHLWLGELLIQLGREDEALAATSRARALDPLAPIHSNNIAWIHNQTGDYEAAITLRNQFEPHLYMLLGEPDLVLGWMEGMYEGRNIYLPEQLHRILFEPLHSDPRFMLKRKTGLDRPPAATD